MNAYDRNLPNDPQLAVLHYGDGEYAVLKPGRYVRYWNPVTQEAFAGPEQALERWRELNDLS